MSWGFVRATEDVDLLADIPSSRRKTVLDGLSELYEARWISGDIDDPVRGLIRAKPRKAGRYPVDILAARSAADRAALSRAEEIEVEGQSVPVLRAEDIIAMKLEAGGGRDYEDVRRLLEVRAGQLDEDRLQTSCRERRVSDRLKLARPRS